MNAPVWTTTRARAIVKRLVIEGDLVLDTPACLGNGEGDTGIDLPLLQDPLEGRPLLTGTSIAGALRAWLREWEHGYGQEAGKQSLTAKLFGGNPGDADGGQSALIIDDALGTAAGIERRTEVGLNGHSRTAEHDRLFDRELWAAGTLFPLRLELLITEGDNEAALRQALATALLGFERGKIGVGARKQRGYGACRVAGWRVRKYDLTTPAGLVDWVEEGNDPLPATPEPVLIAAALGGVKPLPDRRRYCAITATFRIDGTLLMGGGEGTSDGPDRVHLHAHRPGHDNPQPIVPGTGVAGALRARADAIAHLLAPTGKAGEQRAKALVDQVFGPRKIDRSVRPWASRLRIHEASIQGSEDWVQFRIRLDRWTAAVLPGALFNAQPATGGRFKLNLRLRDAAPHQVGLLLLLLKDLWDGDLPLGAEIGGGRGRLRGERACIQWQDPDPPRVDRWVLTATADGGLEIHGDPQRLEECVSKSLRECLADTPAATDESAEADAPA